MQTPLEFYESHCSALGAVISDDMLLNPYTNEPFKIGDCPIVLPTKKYLDQNDWSEVVPFHPLSEDAILGQSEIIHFLIQLMHVSITAQMANIIGAMIQVSYQPKIQKKLTHPDVAKELAPLKDSTANTYKRWKAFLPKIKDGELFKFRLDRYGEDDSGEKFLRVGYLDIPALDEDASEGVSLLGFNCQSKRDKGCIIGIIRQVFKDIPTVVYSNDNAPYYHAYLQMLAAMVVRINELGKCFKEALEFEPLETEWIDLVDDLNSLHGRIPPLPGNEGVELRNRPERKLEVDVDNDIFSKVNVERKSSSPAKRPSTSRRYDVDDRRDRRGGGRYDDDDVPWKEDRKSDTDPDKEYREMLNDYRRSGRRYDDDDRRRDDRRDRNRNRYDDDDDDRYYEGRRGGRRGRYDDDDDRYYDDHRHRYSDRYDDDRGNDRQSRRDRCDAERRRRNRRGRHNGGRSYRY